MMRKKQLRPRTSRRNGTWRLVRGVWRQIVYFDGFDMRRVRPDLDLMFWRGDGGELSSVAESHEIRIDASFAGETDFLVEVYRIESMRRWWKKDKNGRRTPYAKMREYLKRKLCLPGPMPPFIERTEWDAENGLWIDYVRGDTVRQYLDPHFSFGGQNLVYPYIPGPRRAWLDVLQDPRDLPFTREHEINELGFMEQGMTYEEAHRRATAIELKSRARSLVVRPVRRDPVLSEKKLPPLNVVPIAQEDGPTCGPASLRMMLNALGCTRNGKPYTEKRLVRVSGCTADGTDHARLIEGARRLGAHVFVKENGTLDELRHFILKERLSVMVGWWSGPARTHDELKGDPDLDEGHFSVAMHVTASRVWLADPWVDELDGGGIRKLPLRQFLRRSSSARPEFSWCDTDTPNGIPINRWMMVINFDGRTWNVPGGRNYPPLRP